jgi:drug/metabolite transporter (DMT)-like permease
VTMDTFEAAVPYLLGSVMILLVCLLWVTGLLDIRSQMREGISSPKTLVFVAVVISILTVCLIATADAVFIDKSSGTHSPWSDWGFRLGS